jgi:chorismate lyase/3-hydroxybenzoate synthase
MRSPFLSLAPDRSTGAIVSRFAPAAEVRAGLLRNVMACIRFGRPPETGDDPREIPLALAPLGGLAPLQDDAGAAPVELWTSDRPVDYDRQDGFGFATNGAFLVGHMSLLEVEPEAIAAASFKAYARLTAFLERQGYPRLLRCWNFLHDINRGEHDDERYKQFSLGRYQALAGRAGFERQLPAATAIGLRDPGLLIYFLAAKEAGVQVENPRQVPAFQYPRQYGPRSPSFSRATLARFGDVDHLLVSGTASVVGHATQHPNDPAAQLDETLANVEALLQHAAATHLKGGAWVPETLRLFVRDPADLPMARRRLQRALGPDAPVLVLEGDICRHDLRLEIEGLYRAAPGRRQ